MSVIDVLVGMDGGSTSTKAIFADAVTGKLLDRIYVASNGRPAEAGLKIFEIMMGSHPNWRVKRYWTTGSARGLLLETFGGDGAISEIVAQAKGVTAVLPGILMIFDLGGLDSKAILLDEHGRILAFAMNPICGAATGQAIDNQCHQANCTSLADFDQLALTSLNPADFNTRCSVMMVAGWIAHQARGVELPDRIKGFLIAIAKCFISNTVHKARLRIPSEVAFVGMPAGLIGLRDAMRIAAEDYCGNPVEIIVPEKPEKIYSVTAAYGAALLAGKDLLAKGGQTGFKGIGEIQLPEGVPDVCADCPNKCKLLHYHDSNGVLLYTHGRACNK